MLTASKGNGTVSSDIDPFSRGFFADPYPFHETMRETGPIVYLQKYDVWSVWRYPQVRAILSDWQTYCSGAGVGISNFHKEGSWCQPSMPLESDPPVHTKARTVMNRVLSPAALLSLQQGFYNDAVRLVEPLLDRGCFDAVESLALPYPLKVFPDAVGLTSEGREHFLAFGDMAFNMIGPKNEFYEAAMVRSHQLIPWITAQCQRSALRPDSLGADVYRAADAGKVTQEEAALLVRSFLSAGVDTTVHALGNAIYCFAENPDQWSKLRRDPSQARAAFEEVMRFESPFQAFFRTTAKPVEFGGVHIPAEEKIYVSCGSANRDSRQWENPHEFDIGRRTIGHMGFGTGIHGCVGQMIARLEVEIMLRALVERVEAIELTEKPERLLHNTLRAVTKLPVAMKRARN